MWTDSFHPLQLGPSFGATHHLASCICCIPFRLFPRSAFIAHAPEYLQIGRSTHALLVYVLHLVASRAEEDAAENSFGAPKYLFRLD